MKRKLYVIVNASTGLLWSNTMGWVDQHDMDTYTAKERRENPALPFGNPGDRIGWRQLSGGTT